MSVCKFVVVGVVVVADAATAAIAVDVVCFQQLWSLALATTITQ